MDIASRVLAPIAVQDRDNQLTRQIVNARKSLVFSTETRKLRQDISSNLGQCVAAAHVAKNLNIPGGFDALRAKMTGKGAVSLGKAIEALEPSANAKSEMKKAIKQTSDDMKEGETGS